MGRSVRIGQAPESAQKSNVLLSAIARQGKVSSHLLISRCLTETLDPMELALLLDMATRLAHDCVCLLLLPGSCEGAVMGAGGPPRLKASLVQRRKHCLKMVELSWTAACRRVNLLEMGLWWGCSTEKAGQCSERNAASWPAAYHPKCNAQQ